MKELKQRLLSLVADYAGLLCALVLMLVTFALKAENFFTLTTFRAIANQIPDTMIVAVGMTFVLIIAGIDLSVGSVMALGGAVLGTCLLDFAMPLPVAIAACIAVGLLCGLANGVIIIRWRLPAFIVTLGMLEIARGAAYHVTGSRTAYLGGSLEVIADARILGFSVPFLLALAIVIAAQITLSRTVFGRYLIAIGTNEEAVRLCGIDPRPFKLAVYALCGLLTSLAAVIHTARLSAADPNAGSGLELQAIAAVVIGGTSLMGGRGSVVSTFFGVLVIKILDVGLAQMGAAEATKRIVTGCVIVAAVVLDTYRHRITTAKKSA